MFKACKPFKWDNKEILITSAEDMLRGRFGLFPIENALPHVQIHFHISSPTLPHNTNYFRNLPPVRNL